MVSFQETAVIDVEMVRRPSPGRRRLRFSFPFNDVKDQTGEPARRLAPGGGEERVFSRPDFRRQSTSVRIP